MLTACHFLPYVPSSILCIVYSHITHNFAFAAYLTIAEVLVFIHQNNYNSTIGFNLNIVLVACVDIENL